MSTVNPDERARAVAMRVRPVAFVLAIAVQFLAPVAALLTVLGIITPDPGIILVYVFAWVAIGLVTLWVPSNRSPYLLAAFCLAYVAGLFLVIALGTPGEPTWDVISVVVIGGAYGVAVVLVVLHLLRENAMRRTREVGVDTTGTVISAAVTGMVNYVTRQRLTVKFTDQQGVERYVRVGRTGGGWSAGDTIPVRYDPARPGYTRGIIVNGTGPTLFNPRLN
jgi:hypothetical protein